MTRHVEHSQLLVREEIASPPRVLASASDDRSFELPTGLYLTMAGLFLGFVTTLTMAFSGHMAVSYGVIVAFIAAFFAVPAIFARAGRGSGSTHALRWGQFFDQGIATGTGSCSGTDATVLVLTLPVLIFGFGVAVATIAAVVN
jgi:hypothetical protein